MEENKINKIITDFKSIKNPTVMDCFRKSEKIADIISDCRDKTKKKDLCNKYKSSLADIDINQLKK